MTSTGKDNIRLGLFVVLGTAVLISVLYLIGSKRSMFSSTITVHAQFKNVSGLMPGNNVRYAGIAVGTVEEIHFENDTVVTVDMIIEKDAQDHIKKNATVSIGTDGLMGNRLINITAVSGDAAAIQEGDMLASVAAVDTEDMMRTLDMTNADVSILAYELKELVIKLQRKGNLIDLLTDTMLAGDVQVAVAEFKNTAKNAEALTADLETIMQDVQQGKGVIGALLYDDSAGQDIRTLMGNMQRVSDSLRLVTADMQAFTKRLNDPNNAIGALTRDTAVAGELRRTITQLEQSSQHLNEDLQALQRNFLFRRYFREKRKEAEKFQDK